MYYHDVEIWLHNPDKKKKKYKRLNIFSTRKKLIEDNLDVISKLFDMNEI